MTRIFISYRRQDTRQIAGRIFDRLEAHFGRDHVFMDIDSIPFGVDFHDYLDEQVGRAETVLALIGPGWAEARDEAGNRRLDNPDDFVRIEIEAALRRGIPLGAVLIDGAPMPQPEQLPEDMRTLCRRNAAPVDSGRDFHGHMSRLIADLERHLSGGFGQAPAAGDSRAQTSRRDGAIKVIVGTGRDDREVLIAPGSGESFRDADFAPEMVVVPAGRFLMGSPESEEGRLSDDEGLQHEVTVPQPFAVGKYPVTFDEWDAFDRAGGIVETKQTSTGLIFKKTETTRHKYTPDDNGWGRDNRPLIRVSWDDAQAYVKWLSEKTGKSYRLLSEAEWEYAARAGTTTRYAFGDSISTSQARFSEGSSGSARTTAEVGKFEPNAWGLHDMHGNVWELVEDCWNASYADKPEDLKASGGAWTTGDCSRRVLRGGSWGSLPNELRSVHRDWINCRWRHYDVGFRLARTITP